MISSWRCARSLVLSRSGPRRSIPSGNRVSLNASLMLGESPGRFWSTAKRANRHQALSPWCRRRSELWWLRWRFATPSRLSQIRARHDLAIRRSRHHRRVLFTAFSERVLIAQTVTAICAKHSCPGFRERGVHPSSPSRRGLRVNAAEASGVPGGPARISRPFRGSMRRDAEVGRCGVDYGSRFLTKGASKVARRPRSLSAIGLSRPIPQVANPRFVMGAATPSVQR
jgi:hypothetical protein